MSSTQAVVSVGSLLGFDDASLEAQYQQHFVQSRLKYDAMAAVFEAVTSLGFAFKLKDSLSGRAPVPIATNWPSITMNHVFLFEVAHRLLPAAAALAMGPRFYSTHRSSVMVAARMAKAVFVAGMVAVVGVGWGTSEYSLGGLYASVAGQATYPLFNQLPFVLHVPLQAALLASSSLFLASTEGGVCTALSRLAESGGSVPGGEECRRLQHTTAWMAGAANKVVGMLMPGLGLHVQSRNGCRVLWLMLLMLVSCAASAAVYLTEARQRDAFLQARGLSPPGGSCDRLTPCAAVYWPMLPLAVVVYWSTLVLITTSDGPNPTPDSAAGASM